MDEVATKLKTYRFDDMAFQVKDKVHPGDTDVDRYVGLEHIDPGSLKIRRWGEPGDVESTKILFKAGDIIFGKRRAYQRKLAVADFDGICSAHAMVLRPRTEVVLKEFLPFFMQTDVFMERAVKISVGGLSPTINWRDLAKEKFALPPIEEQRRMVRVLNADLAAQDRLHDLAENTSAVLASFINSRLRGLHLGELKRHDRAGRYHSGWPLVPLADLLEMSQYGLSEVAADQGQYPILRMMNLKNGYAVENDIVYIDLDDEEFNRYRLHQGDVLFNRTNSYELVGRTGVYELDGAHVFASYLVRLRTQRDLLDPTYLCAFLNAPIGRRQVMSFATRGVSQTNVNASNLGRVLLPLPPLEYQQDTVSAIRALRTAADFVKPRIQVASDILTKIIEKG